MMTVEDRLKAMFVEDTGRHFLDSGMADGRRWQMNQKNHPCNDPEIEFDENIGCMTINAYHHLLNILDTDELCDRFNALNEPRECLYEGEMPEKMDDLITPRLFTIDAYNLLCERFVKLKRSYNTYNFDCALDHVLIVNELVLEDDEGYDEAYVLINVHLGCDVRGGYGTAFLFKESHWTEFNVCPSVWGTVKRGGTEFEINTDWDGVNLRVEDTSDYYEYAEGDVIDLHLTH